MDVAKRLTRGIRACTSRRRPCTARRSTLLGDDSPPTLSSWSAARIIRRTTRSDPWIPPGRPPGRGTSGGHPGDPGERNGEWPSSPGSTARRRRPAAREVAAAEADPPRATLEIVPVAECPPKATRWASMIRRGHARGDAPRPARSGSRCARRLGRSPRATWRSGRGRSAPEDDLLSATRRREPRIERFRPVRPRIGQPRPSRRAACAGADRRPPAWLGVVSRSRVSP